MNMLPALLQFMHRACFSPVVDTGYKSIDAGYFANWPGLISKLVRKHLPTSIETAKGHLRLSHQHILTTSSQPPLTPPPPPAHIPTYDDGRNSLHGEPSPRKPGMYAAGRSVRPDLFRSNRPIPQSHQQGEQVSDGAHAYTPDRKSVV